MQHVSVVHISHHQVDVGYTKRNIKGERPLFTVGRIITILFKKKLNNKEHLLSYKQQIQFQ